MSFRKGVRSGEVSLREMAAYYIDQAKLFSVPLTMIAMV